MQKTYFKNSLPASSRNPSGGIRCIRRSDQRLSESPDPFDVSGKAASGASAQIRILESRREHLTKAFLWSRCVFAARIEIALTLVKSGAPSPAYSFLGTFRRTSQLLADRRGFKCTRHSFANIGKALARCSVILSIQFVWIDHHCINIKRQWAIKNLVQCQRVGCLTVGIALSAIFST